MPLKPLGQNKDFPLLSEVTALVIKSQILLEKRLDKEVAKLGDVRFMALLGLFIGKTGAPVDMLVIGDVDKHALKNLMAEMEKDLGCEVNYALMTAEEYRYRRDIHDRFLQSILDAPKNVLIDRMERK